MMDAEQIVELHRQSVALWHQQEIKNSYQGFLHLVCEEHKFNYLLWHEEDVARSPEISDARIAEVKRAIDRYNQQRNDGIEKLDDHLVTELRSRGIEPATDARLNSETPGSIIDRLSI